RRQSLAQQRENVEGNGLLFVAEHTQAVYRSQVRKQKPAAIPIHRKCPDAFDPDNPAAGHRIGLWRHVPDEERVEPPPTSLSSRSSAEDLKSLPPVPCRPKNSARVDSVRANQTAAAGRAECPRDIGAPRFRYPAPIEILCRDDRPKSSAPSALD